MKVLETVELLSILNLHRSDKFYNTKNTILKESFNYLIFSGANLLFVLVLLTQNISEINFFY